MIESTAAVLSLLSNLVLLLVTWQYVKHTRQLTVSANDAAISAGKQVTVLERQLTEAARPLLVALDKGIVLLGTTARVEIENFGMGPCILATLKLKCDSGVAEAHLGPLPPGTTRTVSATFPDPFVVPPDQLQLSISARDRYGTWHEETQVLTRATADDDWTTTAFGGAA